MDDISEFNRQRWNSLVKAGIVYSRPMLNLTQETAFESLDPYHIMGSVQGKDESQWNNGYPVRETYLDGEIKSEDTNWDVWHEDGSMEKVPGPREFRHTLSHFINSLIAQGFLILGIWEELSGNPQAEPGTWEHFKAVAPPWLNIWTQKMN